MYNTDIDFDLLVNDNLPSKKKKENIITWISVLLKPFKAIYNDFLNAKDTYIYKVAFNGQTDMLERILNDKFDNVDRQIFITQNGVVDVIRSFYEVESEVQIYSYYVYNAMKEYDAGDYCTHDGFVWMSAVPSNLGNTPNTMTAEWQQIREADYKNYLSDYNFSAGFTVNVPSALTYDEIYMRKLIEYYKLAGRPYTIIEF